MENITFESIKIGLASPDKIREWSYGEVTKPETINYRTLKPESDGLFCERIFGPLKDWECHCGRYKRIRHKGKKCERCGVEITKAKVRRERMGHIELATPVSHIWYFKGIPSRMGLILDISPRDLERILYFSAYVVINPGTLPGIEKGKTLNEKEYQDLILCYYNDFISQEDYLRQKNDPEVSEEQKALNETKFRAGMGAEAIKELLCGIDVDELDAELRESLETASGQKKARILKRLDVVSAFKASGNRPEWMVLDVVPVIPPDIRPMVQLDGGRFATSDLNDLYRRVINRNNRLKKLLELGAPSIIIRNEKRMLQEAVDALIDNGRRGRPVTGPNNRPLKSLSEMLKGKQGRFRQNLLGKRVDYSGRSVIVVGPELKLYQCGLPKEMALELFKPFVMKRLVETGASTNIKTARKTVDRQEKCVWDALEIVIKDHPVMLNRAPTLHRLGIQAFEPVLVEGKAIKLHPLVCTAFNADFDGDQMAVHVPLSAEAQAEARFLMLAANNLLKPSDGKPVAVPSQDMVLGSYYLTLEIAGAKGEGKAFRDVNEARLAYDSGVIDLHARIKIRMTKTIDGEEKSKLIETTLGKVIFNDPVPQDLGFVDRTDPENAFRLEVEGLVGKSLLGKVIARCIQKHGTAKTAEVLDNIKNQGYKFSTKSGITVAVCDATIPAAKKEILAETERQVDEVNRKYNRGLLSNQDRSRQVLAAWDVCTSRVADALKGSFEATNPIWMMLDSGARGSESQLRQLAGMRGLIANTAGKTIEVPIRANYREGLNVQEYFISSRGARKGLADTALRTADSGYLTRRLVDVSQDVIIREEDCGCTEGLEVYDIMDGNRVLEPFAERLKGRYLLHSLVDETTGEVIMDNEHMLTEADAEVIDKYLTKKMNDALDNGASKEEAMKYRRITIRSLLTCNSDHGACIKCYGANLASGQPVTVGEAVGIIAAQSIGEPGTQLTMRTFHTGGVASGADITQGLPRVEELFEARKPKTLAILSEIDGVVSFETIKKNPHIVVTDEETGERKEYFLTFGARARVSEGQHIEKGETITEGSIDPRDVLNVLGVNALHDYLISQVQQTYRTQGVDINDKHIEVIARQMMRKIRVEDPGDTDLLPNAVVDKKEFRLANEAVAARMAETGEELRFAESSPVLMGITKASLATDSFLSAASFQETTRVLTDAAIKGKVDPLLGLKENVIIGKLLPSGTGMKCYSNVEFESTETDSDDDADAIVWSV